MTHTSTGSAMAVAEPTGGDGSPLGWVGVEIVVAGIVLVAAIALVRRARRRPAPGPEAAAWAAFLVACLLRLSLVDPKLRLGGVIVVGALTLWFLLTVGVEIARGVAVRLDPTFGVGVQVVIDDLEGRIRRLRSRWVEIETSDGWLVQVPYRRLGRGIRIRSAGHRTAVPVRFELELPPSADVAAARARARELVVCSPWSNLSPAPDVVVDDPGRSVLRVEAYTFSREGRSRLVADVVSAWRAA